MSAEEIKEKIEQVENKIRMYSELYDRMNSIYSGSLIQAKSCSENIYNGVYDNYGGNNTEPHVIAGRLNGYIYGMQAQISNLCDHIYEKIESLNNELAQLQVELENCEE